MSDLLKFSDYDVFAYLATGFAALAVSDAAVGTTFVLGADWTPASGTLTVAGAYVAGQILASPAAWLLQNRLTHRFLLAPTMVLMNARPLGWRRALRRSFLATYYEPLEENLRAKVRAASRTRSGAELEGEALFWCAFTLAKADPITYSRMESFLKLYGFCRNLAFVGLVGAAVIATSALVHWIDGHGALAAALAGRSAVALLVGVGMLHRYLKFYRAYAVEVLLSLASKGAAA